MIFTIILTFLMFVYLHFSIATLLSFWGDIPKFIKIAILITIFPMFLGILGFLFNSLKVLDRQGLGPKYELIEKPVYLKIK